MAAARQVFTRTIQRTGLTADTPVAISVGGGCESLALTLLARQAFQKIIGITVDHRLHEWNTLETKRAGELVRSLGVEHHIVSLNWEKEKEGIRGVFPPKLSQVANKSYLNMLQFCQRKNISSLMTAHHLDTLIESFLLHVARGDGDTDIMGGWYPSTVRSACPGVNILRPFLEVQKADLQEVCQNEGVEWIEEPSYQLDGNIYKNIREVIQQNEELVPGITGLLKTCRERRRHLEQQANEGLSRIDLTVNQEYGYLSFTIGKLLSLPSVVMNKVIQSLSGHTGGTRRSTEMFARFHRKLLCRDPRPELLGGCFLFIPDKDNDTMIMGRAPPEPAKMNWIPISVGQTVHWDKRWKVTLKPLEKLNERDGDQQASGGVMQNEELLYVRYMKIEECWGKKDQSIAKEWTYADIPPYTRILLGLPVVCTKSGDVVLAPHFKIINHSYGVDCDVTFDPLLPLRQDPDTLVH